MEELYATDLPPGSTLREKRKRTCILPEGNIRDISVPATYIIYMLLGLKFISEFICKF
jgi:hypothetical protein